ncbi:hypothetical protein [Staphylococcus epidermidis]|uniref:hypothetical protein n=1 Tax=Staphylococcus epidermidis TaxID=1282 RepID=UPI00352C375D
MTVVIEFIKELFTNPEIIKPTLIMTIVFSIIWYMYQTIADTNARKYSNKYRKSYIGQLITGKEKNSNQTGVKDSKKSNLSQNTDLDVDNMIIKMLREYKRPGKNFKDLKTSRGYNAEETYKDLNNIIKYKNDIKKVIKESKNKGESERISSFRIVITDNSVIIHSMTIPNIKMSVNQALNIENIDSLKGIIDNNKILSAFAFDY